MTQTLSLREHEAREVALAEHDVSFLQEHFRRVIVVRPTTRPGRYELKAKAIAGTIVGPSLELRIRPKCGLRNLFGMLSHVHHLAKLRPELVHQAEDEDLRGLLVIILVQHLETLVRGGLRRGYVEDEARLPVLRGRLALDQQLRTMPGGTLTIACRYEDYTADLPINQVIGYTLSQIGGTGSPQLDQRVRRSKVAFARLTPRRFRPSDLEQFTYDRLNAHYEVIHGICRLILQARGAEDAPGALPMGSFLVNMNTLFQEFVATWFERNLPAPWRMRAQGAHSLDRQGWIKIFPDLLLYHDRELRLVADTKYKLCRGEASSGDLYQALAYCRALRVRGAVLLYPDVDDRHLHLVIADGANELLTDGVDLARPWAEVEEAMRRLMERLLELAKG
ncbi:MAG: hypothetical protein KDK70_06405 [Myxococcales bacterium]|nr:hypothetical protein [Myxococcales bacterium]